MKKFGNQVGGQEGRASQRRRLLVGRGRRATTGNCWFDNTGPDGTAASVTGPGAGDGADTLPSDCASSAGTGDSVKFAYLLACFLAREGDLPPEQCDWYELPPKPGSAAARKQGTRVREVGVRKFLKTERAAELEAQLDEITGIADSVPKP